MLKQFIHDKINEVFTEYQKANNIISGDIDPWDAQCLDDLEDKLARLIQEVCMTMPKAINFDHLAPSWYIYLDYEGVAHSVTHDGIDMDKFFYEVSKRIAFDDCTEEAVVKIYYRGKEVIYAGWQPGMIFEYKDLDGNTIWVGDFPHWDH